MKKVLLVLIILTSFSQGFCQNFPTIEWQKSYGGSQEDEAYDIELTHDGGYILAGLSNNNGGDVTGNHGGFDYWIVKLSNNGTIQWQKSYGGSGDDFVWSITPTSDGGYITAGQSESIDGDVTGNHGLGDCWIVKLDSLGSIEWQKCYGGTRKDVANIIKNSIDGGYIISGSTESIDGDVTGNHNTIGSTDIWLIKIDVNGSIQWEKCYGGSYSDDGGLINLTSDGGYIVAGNSFSNDGDVSSNYGSYDWCVFRLDSLGNILWQKSYGGSGDDQCRSVLQTNDGGFIFSGLTQSADHDVIGQHGIYDFWVVKVDLSGTIEWQRPLGGSSYEDWGTNLEQTADSGYIVCGSSNSNDGDVVGHIGSDDYWIVKLDKYGVIQYQRCLGGMNSDLASSFKSSGNNEITICGSSYSSDGDLSINYGNADIWVVKLNLRPIRGSVFPDLNHNCVQDPGEIPIGGILLQIDPGNIIVTTNQDGFWTIDSLSDGNYTITIDTINSIWSPTCSASQPFVVNNGSTMQHNFGVLSSTCPIPEITLSATHTTRCNSVPLPIYVYACNYSSVRLLINSYADIKLDSSISIVNSTRPYSTIGPNLYRFMLDTIYPEHCNSFELDVFYSCDLLIGQTVCMEGRLYPQDTCVFDTIPDGISCTTSWDHSNLDVTGICQNDSVCFTIHNTGSPSTGDMQCYSKVRIFQDAQLIEVDSVHIAGGDSSIYCFYSNGHTIRLEVDQHPLHPGNSHPNSTIELCGNIANWVPGLVTALPSDDADPFVDINCFVIRSSYDPNEKIGYPTGVGSNNNISPNQQIQYQINFQNTGTDTAINVVIHDTLDTNLNIFTVRPGVSSSGFDFRIFGPHILEWKLNNIMLPDSNADETASHGFVTFTVQQAPDLPNFTQIPNQAFIYFDNNVPVSTNLTLHTVNRQLLDLTTIESKSPHSPVQIYPNPASDYFNVISGYFENNQIDFLEILNMNGQVIQQAKLTANNENIFYLNNFLSGVYSIKIHFKNGTTGFQKLIVIR